MNLTEILTKANEHGIPAPLIRDPVRGAPSITLTTTYVGNLVAIIAVVCLLISDVAAGSILACLYGTVTTILYMMRSLHKAKIDFDDKSIDLESESEGETNEPKS